MAMDSKVAISGAAWPKRQGHLYRAEVIFVGHHLTIGIFGIFPSCQWSEEALINVPLKKCINKRTWSLTVFGISSLETLRSEKSSFHLPIVLLQSCSFRAKSRSRNSRNSRNPYDLHATLTFTAFTSGHLSHVSACCRAPACPIEVQHVSGTGAVCWIGNANRAWNDLTSPRHPRHTPNTPAFTAWSQILVNPGDTFGEGWGGLGRTGASWHVSALGCPYAPSQHRNSPPQRVLHAGRL